MNIQETAIPGLVILDPVVHGDERGFFLELFHAQKFAEAGLPTEFVQDNLSRSRQGTLRGLHYQIQKPQGKLIRALSGVIFDVAVDLRRSSVAFGKAVGVELSAESHRQLYVPAGCAHGFLVVSETADVFYKCTDLYAPQHERTLMWNDPALEIAWPIDNSDHLTLSEKDLAGVRLEVAETYQ